MRKGKNMKRFKRAWAVLLCCMFTICMLMPAGVRAEEGENENAKVLNQITLSVGDEQKTPVYKAGEKTELKINVQNKGDIDAQNVMITPVINSTDEWPFDMEKLNYEQDLGTIAAGAQATALWGGDDDKLTVKSDVTGKSYKLVFKLTYDDGEKAYETERYVFVKTEAKKTTSGSGNSDKGHDNSQSDKPSDNNGGGNNGSSGSYVDTGDDGIVYNGDPISTGGDVSSAGDGSVPRVIVTGFDTDPGTVKAGSNFKLVIHLKNTSKKTAVKNMLFDLQAPAAGTDEAAEDPAFLPVSGSSSIYLDSIPAGGTKDISIELNARADLVQKPYSISMSMKYEDSAAAQYEAQSSLAIPVRQEARFEFSKMQIAPDTVSVGEEVNISCSLYNLGRVKMYNVKARFEGKMIDTQEQFIGNLDAGATGTIDAIVTAKKATKGTEECKLVLTYEDDAGNVSTSEQKFQMTVLEEAAVEDAGMMPEAVPEEGGSPGILAAVVLAVIAAAAGGTVAFIKRRKKKNHEAEEEEMFDEVERFTEDEH